MVNDEEENTDCKQQTCKVKPNLSQYETDRDVT